MLSPDVNPGRRGGKPATIRLSNGTALNFVLSITKKYAFVVVVVVVSCSPTYLLL
jgi:hypothetical protein